MLSRRCKVQGTCLQRASQARPRVAACRICSLMLRVQPVHSNSALNVDELLMIIYVQETCDDCSYWGSCKEAALCKVIRGSS